jgi:hypothetical protein
MVMEEGIGLTVRESPMPEGVGAKHLYCKAVVQYAYVIDMKQLECKLLADYFTATWGSNVAGS